jgi:hypothetical protein
MNRNTLRFVVFAFSRFDAMAYSKFSESLPKGKLMKTLTVTLIAAAAAFMLAACGGGGGGTTATTGPIASINTFNLQSGYASLVSSGFSKTFSISGSCAGTLTLTRGPATTAATFEGVAANSGTSATTLTFTNCTPSSIAATSIQYYDSNYLPKGYSVQGGNYGVYVSTPVISSAAKVGDVVVVGTTNLYTNSTKATGAGHADATYVVEPDTATTAIINLIDKTYNSSNVLTSTEQDRYRVAANGALTPLSVDIQYSNGSTTHLVGN